MTQDPDFVGFITQPLENIREELVKLNLCKAGVQLKGKEVKSLPGGARNQQEKERTMVYMVS